MKVTGQLKQLGIKPHQTWTSSSTHAWTWLVALHFEVQAKFGERRSLPESVVQFQNCLAPLLSNRRNQEYYHWPLTRLLMPFRMPNPSQLVCGGFGVSHYCVYPSGCLFSIVSVRTSAHRRVSLKWLLDRACHHSPFGERLWQFRIRSAYVEREWPAFCYSARISLPTACNRSNHFPPRGQSWKTLGWLIEPRIPWLGL